MAKAIPAMSGNVEEDKEASTKEVKVEEKKLVNIPKTKEKITLPDGTVIETY